MKTHVKAGWDARQVQIDRYIAVCEKARLAALETGFVPLQEGNPRHPFPARVRPPRQFKSVAAVTKWVRIPYKARQRY